MTPDQLATLLEQRTTAAAALLEAAIRIDFHRFVGMHVQDRLRSRPHFFAHTPNRAFVFFRGLVTATAERAVVQMAEPIRDLRIYYGASPRGHEEEASGLAKTLAGIAETTRVLLSEFAFPGDQRPDRADVTQMDLDAEYQLDYAASPSVLWAWRQLRELDEVRNQIADAGGAPEVSFEIRYHLPEFINGGTSTT